MSFQDANFAQVRFSLHSRHEGNIFAVGDPDSRFNHFRGALKRPHLSCFAGSFPTNPLGCIRQELAIHDSILRSAFA